MQGPKKIPTQKEILSGKLIAISVDVTASDRDALSDEKGFAKSTISEYLNGNVRDNDTGVIILQFFTGKIKARYEAMNKTA